MANNKGLSHRFIIKNGSFQLTEGGDKVRDNLYFLMCFDKVSRIYKDDFAPKILWLIQKPTAFVDLYKTLLLGKLKKVILKYVVSINIKSLDLVSHRPSGELSYEVFVNYTYIGDDGKPVDDFVTKFI